MIHRELFNVLDNDTLETENEEKYEMGILYKNRTGGTECKSKKRDLLFSFTFIYLIASFIK